MSDPDYSANQAGVRAQRQAPRVGSIAALPGGSAPPSSTFTIQPPEPFDFSKPQEWEKWIRRFERFWLASNLHTASHDSQINTLVYCMGDEADDILRGLNLTDAQRDVYTTVKESFNRFFVQKKNVIYEQAQFNLRVQQANYTVDSFITTLYALAENCNYGQLHDELLRDSLWDTTLSERMQLDRELTLEKALNMARQSEIIKIQQTDLRGEISHSTPKPSHVNAVHTKKHFKSNVKKKNQIHTQGGEKHSPQREQEIKEKRHASSAANHSHSFSVLQRLQSAVNAEKGDTMREFVGQ
ncbi:hypothetical protein LDENG_00201450 [Lucifuga dentata]|nr:hypothetical protein LDENG_00201450 [Lucifuga dentata]